MFDTRLHVNFGFRLPWRHYLSLDLNGTYKTNKPNNSSTNQSIYYANQSTYKILEYFNDNANHHYSYSAELGYNINLPKGWSFGPSISFINRQDNKTQNYFAKDSLDDHLDTNSYNYHSTEHKWQAALNVTRNINNSIFSLKIPVDWAKEQMYYHQSLLDTIANRSKVLFNPNLWYSRFGKNKQTIKYDMNVEQPSFDLLMPYKNSINPLLLAINNPNLRNRITHDLQMSTNIRNDSLDLTWWVKADASCILHEWGNHVNYDTTTGSYTYRMDNVSKPNWQANLEIGLDKYLDLKKRISLDIDATIKYDHNVDFDIAYNNTTANLSLVKTLVTGLNAKLNYRYETFSAGLTGKVSGRFSRSDRTDFTSINAYDYQYGGKLQYTIPIIKFTIATDATMYSRRGYGSSLMNTNDFLLNAQLTHPFAKGRIIAKLQTFDLLHQMKSTKYSVNAQGRTEIRYNNIPSYLMFSLSFNLIKGKQK
ncbi:outer membrane beta-barrel protein [Prevotella sp.]|uniref:outer membrane beta-barrel protein n=1 Tax=Prevotella sp. TaxID=59823 RepID=UPI003DA55C67